MGRETQGICPRCQASTGMVGESCRTPECLSSGYSLIPLLSYDAARARADKKNGRIDPRIGRRIDRYLITGKAGEGGKALAKEVIRIMESSENLSAISARKGMLRGILR